MACSGTARSAWRLGTQWVVGEPVVVVGGSRVVGAGGHFLVGCWVGTKHLQVART